MKKYFRKSFFRFDKLLLLMVLSFSLFPSCKDDYYYDDEEPAWLGGSIYEYLQKDGHFNYTLKMADRLDYAEVLKLTGSKTLFVVNDSAYDEFFKSNSWGVTKYEDLTDAQVKLLFNFGMVNNPYNLKKFSNYNLNGILIEETAMRQETALDPIDSVSFDKGDQLPSSKYWTGFKESGIHLLKDNTKKPIVYFTQEFIDKYSLTDEDFSILTGGTTRSKGDVHFFNDKIVKKDIRCKNGYIHVLNNVLVPPTNMAQYVLDNPKTTIFSKLLERFSAPYLDIDNTTNYKLLHPEFTGNLYEKRYFSSNGGYEYLPGSDYLPSATTKAQNLLPYDPGWNSYKSSALEADMAAMFVPTDEAMNDYFNSGIGAILKDRFGSWDSIPDKIIVPFLKRHMRTSMIESVPSRFDKMVDGENYALPVKKSHIENTYTAVNGEVFVTNSVYPPVDYISVYSPVLLSDNAKIMNWAINAYETSYDNTQFAFYKLYLNSLVCKYSLMIPTDLYLSNYLDPIAYGQDVQGVLKFWFDTKNNVVNATIYKYNKSTGVVGDSVGVINGNANVSVKNLVRNRLWNILDNHIVVGNIESGDEYYVTKGNDIVKVSGSGNSLSIQGGNDITNNTSAHVTDIFDQYNGKTYFLDKPIDSSLKSVYKVLSETPQFSMFFELLNGVPDSCVSQIFAQQGIDYRIKFFNAFRYTVYVPTNDAIQQAIDNKTITPWNTIYSMSDSERGVAINKMIQFLKYHFQDNAVFFGQNVNGEYQSAALKSDNTSTYWGTSKNKYFKLGVTGSKTSLAITMDSKSGDPLRVASVKTDEGLYNIIAKDYVFDKLPTAYKNVDGTGSVSGVAFSSSLISTSASAVIHQIDKVLTFE